jgi:hypothetical protein
MIIKTREFSEFPSIADHLIYYPGQSQNCRLISVENVLSKFPTSENRRVEFLTEFFVEFREFSVDFRYLNILVKNLFNFIAKALNMLLAGLSRDAKKI